MPNTFIDLFATKESALTAATALAGGNKTIILYIEPGKVQFNGMDGDTALMSRKSINTDCYIVLSSDAPFLKG